MANFMIRFLICNIFISGIIGILLIAKGVFKNSLTSRMQYNLWFLLLGLLAVPFLPVQPIGFLQFFSWLEGFKNTSVPNAEIVIDESSAGETASNANWMNDFTLSVSGEMPSSTGIILCGIWILGILTMIILVAKSMIRLNTLRKSALPLQNKEAHRLYRSCLNEMNIVKNIPIYSTAFLKSPIIVGLFKPCIYLPIHLISEHNTTDMRYMLLHELQHYKHKDALANYLMNFAGVLYWFNPFVWYALKEMCNDREVACDTSVLKMLKEESYEDYGNTLINFAEKISLTPFPFTAGLSGSMKQMKQRIINIASYENPSIWKRISGITAFGITTVLLIALAPILSTYAADGNRYQWNTSSENISHIDFSSYFNEYDGSFVLYDLESNSWTIYNMENATMRVAPNSTYKIYDALFGLQEGIITPDNSFIAWNKEEYPFEAWNADQNLKSAMDSSVNWYFQKIDEQLGVSTINSYLEEIGYGNENISEDLSSYWMESSLKISPVEQVELLTKLYTNSLDFSLENINTVKNSIRISSSKNGNFSGKTGTGRVNGEDVNGWFIGYVKRNSHTYFFATNIQNDQNATGSKASEISLSILSDMNIWKQ